MRRVSTPFKTVSTVWGRCHARFPTEGSGCYLPPSHFCEPLIITTLLQTPTSGAISSAAMRTGRLKCTLLGSFCERKMVRVKWRACSQMPVAVAGILVFWGRALHSTNAQLVQCTIMGGVRITVFVVITVGTAFCRTGSERQRANEYQR